MRTSFVSLKRTCKKGTKRANDIKLKMTYNKFERMTKTAVPLYLNVYRKISKIDFIAKHKYSFCFSSMLYSKNNSYFCSMSSIRQSRIEGVIQEELSLFFQRNAREICLGSMVTVTTVRVSPDLSSAKCYLSIFAGPPKDEVLENININASRVRGEVGRRLKNMKHIPSLSYYIDDSLDYASKIDELLKK